MSDKLKITSRIMKSHFDIVAITLLIVVVVMLNGCSKSKPEQQVGTIKTDETLRFVFLADSRGDSLGDPVNTPVLTKTISQIDTLSPRPSFVIFGGASPSTDTIDPAIKISWNVHNDAQTYYFSVVDISGSTVTVNSYSGYTGAYSVFDTFTINK